MPADKLIGKIFIENLYSGPTKPLGEILLIVSVVPWLTNYCIILDSDGKLIWRPVRYCKVTIFAEENKFQ